ncbi:MAG: DMT family transporter [Syntrophomonadaceae bacterium]|nr:DMT family transporter [Syntrophomonadaceae bacterium]
MTPVTVYLLIFLAIACMSTASIMIRYCTAPSLVIALYRVMFTAMLGGMIGQWGTRPGLTPLSRKNLGYCLGAGFFLAVHFGFWITSLNYTTVSSSVLFTNLQVVFVLVFSFLVLGEKVNNKVVFGILLALAGSVLIAGGDFRGGRLGGDLLALVSAVFMAAYLIIGRRVRNQLDVWTYTLVVNGMATLVLLLGAVLAGLALYPYPRTDFIWFFLLALLPGIGGHTILNWALKYVKAPLVAVSILGESVMASILAYFFFGELLLWYQILGALLILTGIYTAAVNEPGA